MCAPRSFTGPRTRYCWPWRWARPCTRRPREAGLAHGIRKQAGAGCLSTVICLEDAVPDDQVAAAEENLLAALAELDAVDDPGELPLIFIRCRTPEQLLDVGRRAGAALGVVYGFVLPKFENETGRGRAFLAALQLLNEETGRAAGSATPSRCGPCRSSRTPPRPIWSPVSGC